MNVGVNQTSGNSAVLYMLLHGSKFLIFVDLVLLGI